MATIEGQRGNRNLCLKYQRGDHIAVGVSQQGPLPWGAKQIGNKVLSDASRLLPGAVARRRTVLGGHRTITGASTVAAFAWCHRMSSCGKGAIRRRREISGPQPDAGTSPGTRGWPRPPG